MIYRDKSPKILTVDLVITFYNGDNYIEDAVKSAIQQSIPFEKIILVDDGSSDLSSKNAKNICEKYGAIYYRQNNSGQGAARNSGVEISNSDFICFLDQDDVLLKYHNEILLNKYMDAGDVRFGMVFGGYSSADEKLNVISKRGFPYEESAAVPNNIYAAIGRNIFALPSASMISRSAFRNLGGFDSRFRGYEDDDLVLRIFSAGYGIYFIDKEVCLWRRHSYQTSSSNLMLKSRLDFIRKWIDFDSAMSLDKALLRKSLFNRFYRTIVKDILVYNENISDDLKLICAKEFLGIFKKDMPIIKLYILKALIISPYFFGKLYYPIWKSKILKMFMGIFIRY